MNYQTVKIYNMQDFKQITKGIKVAKCMRIKSTPKNEIINNVEGLVVSKSLCCSFCNTEFRSKVQQRSHYKLDWHRFNLKQHLHGLKPISEDHFNMLIKENSILSVSDSDIESENEENHILEVDFPSKNCKKNLDSNKDCYLKVIEPYLKSVIFKQHYEISHVEGTQEKAKNIDQNLLTIAARHTKAFFENEDGSIFSVYRCLLYNKKDIPEIDSEIIAKALEIGKHSQWTIILIGGGHFAAAIFSDGNPLVHKTFHNYIIRAKQGSAQSVKDNRGSSNSKTAGANIRRSNEANLIQHAQEILELWRPHIIKSSLILYRAVGPFNRSILFCGKNAPFLKNDSRLRPLPFPTRKATFSEVKRVYDILSNIEVYGAAANFTDCFPISPRQPIRKKVFKDIALNEKTKHKDYSLTLHTKKYDSAFDCKSIDRRTSTVFERHNRNFSLQLQVDRAKPRKSPERPLPDIVAKLVLSSSESESDQNDESEFAIKETNLILQKLEINFREYLKAFDGSISKCMKRTGRQEKRKVKKNHIKEGCMNNSLICAKLNLWNSCENGDFQLFSTSVCKLIAEIKQCKEKQNCSDENKKKFTVDLNNAYKILHIINDANEDGNTLLHVAASRSHLNIVWALMNLGSDPCIKNRKLQTPYEIALNNKTRNIFIEFMKEYPTKYKYNESKIPGFTEIMKKK